MYYEKIRNSILLTEKVEKNYKRESGVKELLKEESTSLINTYVFVLNTKPVVSHS